MWQVLSNGNVMWSYRTREAAITNARALRKHYDKYFPTYDVDIISPDGRFYSWTY